MGYDSKAKTISFLVALLGFLLIWTNSPIANLAASKHTQEPSPSTVRIKLEPVLSGLSSPLYITNAHDGANRLFILEQAGRIRVLQPGAGSTSVFLDISSKLISGGEQGLLGLAFHPQFSTNRRFFVDYTRRSDGATVIAEYRASASNPNIADTGETILLTIAQPFSNHNGGMVEFGPDGYLYIGMGDGGSANDPGNRAQNTQQLLGKILRIDVDQPDGAQPYSSPVTNPYFGADPGRDEIFAIGLRNPWRFSFDRANGDLYVGDVGQNAWEEVDIVTLGGNYGWRVMEANHCTNLGPASCGAPGFTPAIAEYGHTGGRCSITGGYVYRGSKGSLPLGSYVYGDYCTGEIFLLEGGAQSLLLDTNLAISSFGEDEDGEIYVVNLNGTVSRIGNADPVSTTPQLNSAVVRKRATGRVIDPVSVKENGKKFEIVASGEGFASGAVITVNGVESITAAGSTPGRELTARLGRDTLSAPGTLSVIVQNPDGTRSNTIVIQVVAAL